MTTVCIHQPNFAPHAGVFAKMAMSDVHIFLDDVQFSKGSYTNRVKVFGRLGTPEWLTVPIEKASLGTAINKIQIHYSSTKGGGWMEKHMEYITQVSEKWHIDAREELRDEILEVYNEEIRSLSEFNARIAMLIARRLRNVECEMHFASKLRISEFDTATERLVELCRIFSATRYVSGVGARGYMDMDKFREEGIAVVFSERKDIAKRCGIDSYSGMSILQDM